MSERKVLLILVLLLFGTFITVISTQKVFITEPHVINSSDEMEEFIFYEEDDGTSSETFAEKKERENQARIEQERIDEEKRQADALLSPQDKILQQTGRESLCPKEGWRDIWGGERLMVGDYDCDYSKDGELQNFSNEISCKKEFRNEFIRRRYTIVNECLYDNDKLISETPLSHALLNGEFGREYPGAGMGSIFNMEIIFEWHRFIHENKLYILLAGNAGCGGCWDNGPYLIIDLVTGEIQKKFYDFPYYTDYSFSPDGDKIIYIEKIGEGGFEYDLDNQRLHLLDIPTLISKQIYQVPSNQSLVDAEYVTYFIKDAIIWDSNDEIRIAQIKKEYNHEFYGSGYAAYKNGETEQDFYKRYTFLDEPVKVKLSE